MTEIPSVGSASGQSLVFARDIVGRDKVTNPPRPQRALTRYMDLLQAECFNVPDSQAIVGSPHSIPLEDVFLDCFTDAMAPTDSENPAPGKDNHLTVLGALSGIQRLLLLGSRGSGKTTSATRYMSILASDQDQAGGAFKIPFLLDHGDSFGRWVVTKENPQISDVSQYIYDVWGVDLLGIRDTEIVPHFIWDHVQILPKEARAQVSQMLQSIRRWFPDAHHTIMARTLFDVGVAPGGFQLVQILRPTEPQARALIDAYRRHLDVAAIPVEHTTGLTIGSLLESGQLQIERGASDRYVKRIQEALQHVPGDTLAAISAELPNLAWRIIRMEPGGLGYFDCMGVLAGGQRDRSDVSSAVLDELVNTGLLECTKDGEYIAGDRWEVENLAIAAFAAQDILDDALARIPERPYILELVERAATFPINGPIKERISQAIERTVWTPDANEPTEFPYLRLALAASPQLQGSTLEAGSREMLRRIRRRLEQSTELTAGDELAKLWWRVSVSLGDAKPALVFRRFGPGPVTVSVPTGNGERLEHTVRIGAPVWFCESPLTNLQFSALSRSLPDHVNDAVYSVRPEVWRDVKPLLPFAEYCNDPVVGISYDTAMLLSAKISEIASRRLHHDVEIRVPTLGEWGLLDLGPQVGALVNSPAKGLVLRRPVSCGFTGFNIEGISDVYGNVLEWTSTSWGSDLLQECGHPEPYEPGGAWDDGSRPGNLLLRGGSWLFDETGPHCACVLPGDAVFGDVGLRLCFSGSAEGAADEPIILELP